MTACENCGAGNAEERVVVGVKPPGAGGWPVLTADLCPPCKAEAVSRSAVVGGLTPPPWGTRPRCARCMDSGHVCEDHPGMPWEGIEGAAEGHAAHGGAGMPCPACCPPVPQDGRHSAAEAFTPAWRRS